MEGKAGSVQPKYPNSISIWIYSTNEGTEIGLLPRVSGTIGLTRVITAGIILQTLCPTFKDGYPAEQDCRTNKLPHAIHSMREALILRIAASIID